MVKQMYGRRMSVEILFVEGDENGGEVLGINSDKLLSNIIYRALR